VFRPARQRLLVVPQLIGRSAEEVGVLLKRARMQPKRQLRRDLTEPPGTVMEQQLAVE